MRKVIDDDLLQFMGEQESQFLINPSELLSELKKRFLGQEKLTGDTLPWRKTQPYFRLRPGEVTLWAGINSHGKSALLNQICAWCLNKKWLIASMEMLPAETLERMVKQISGTHNPTEPYLENLLNWIDNKLWIYDQTDSVKTERILALVRYAIAHNIDHIVIDSLIKCGIPRDNYEEQALFVDKLCWLAKTNLIHIHLVHHIRKGENESTMPGKFDIRGAGEITDLVDNVAIIFRNKRKEADPEKYADEADSLFKIDKQRKTGWEGTFKLWYHKDIHQYSGEENKRMVHWLQGIL